jgi:hypothetical protein
LDRGRDLPSSGEHTDRRGIAVSKVLESLAPLVKQGIFYRLLTGEQGARLRQIVTVGPHGYQVSRAIDLKH